MASTTLSTGITLEYEMHGDGEPLLLVMGLGGQLVAWPATFIAGLVDRGFKVITFDNRDIGLSTKIDAAPHQQKLSQRCFQFHVDSPSRHIS